MDDSFRLFVEECDTFQVRTLFAWFVRVAVDVKFLVVPGSSTLHRQCLLRVLCQLPAHCLP